MLYCQTIINLYMSLKEHYMKINQRETKILICRKLQIYANIALYGILLETVKASHTRGAKSLATGKAVQIQCVA